MLTNIDLPKQLLDRLFDNNNDLASKLTPLLEADEFKLAILGEPALEIKGALAVLEKQRSLKRCRHLIEAWSSQRLQTLENCIAALIKEEKVESNDSSDMEERVIKMFQELNNDAISFQQMYYAERKNISHLDQQRCAR